MSGTYPEFDPNQIKHMELIQTVITRLANNSFLIKGWAVTVTSAFLGIAVSRGDARFALVALAPIVLFAALDSYFLYAERLFRSLYEQVRLSNVAVEPFFMGATSQEFVDDLQGMGVKKIRFDDALRRPVVWLFYSALVVAAVLVGVLSHWS